MSIRPYIDNKRLDIDGRMIPYPLVTAGDYLEAKHNMSEDEVNKFMDENYEQYTMLNTIIAMKQSCFLLRNVRYSCGSLSGNLYAHKKDMVAKYNETYDVPFDEDFYENYSRNLSKVVDHIKDLDLSNLKMPIGVIYDKPLDYPNKFVIRIFDGTTATNAIILRESLEECREVCMVGGMHTIIPRAIDDDYCIVESWM